MSNEIFDRCLEQFGIADQATRQQVAQHMGSHTYLAGQMIVQTGEPSGAAYLIASGEVRIHRLSVDGREYVLHTLGRGEVLNLASVLDGGYNLATVSALSDTVVYTIPVDVFRQVLREHPELAVTLLEHLSHRVRSLYDAVEDLALHSVRTRLARCLLSAMKGNGSAVQYWTQTELAAHIGTVRDVVGRSLRTFTRHGLIRRERGQIVVMDVAGLRREALVDR